MNNNNNRLCEFVQVVQKANHCGHYIEFENHCVTIFTSIRRIQDSSTNHQPFLFGFDGIYKINADKDLYDTYVRGKNRGFSHVIIISYKMMKQITNIYQFYKPQRLVLIMDCPKSYYLTFIADKQVQIKNKPH